MAKRKRHRVIDPAKARAAAGGGVVFYSPPPSPDQGVGAGDPAPPGSSGARRIVGPYEVLYGQIPAFRCKPGCSACCGPVPFSRAEWGRIPDKRTAAGIDCPYSGPRGCAIYERRPFMCRLFGAAASLSCPFGRRPDRMLSAAEAADLTRRYVELMDAEDLGERLGVKIPFLPPRREIPANAAVREVLYYKGGNN